MKIRTELLVIMVSVVSASIAVTVYIAVNNFVRTVQSEIENEFTVIATNLMDKLSRQMFDRIADIRFLSSSDVLGNENFSLPAKIDYLRNMEKAYKAYASISLINGRGIKIGDTRSLYIGQNESQEPFFQHAIKGEIYYDKIPVLSNSIKQSVIHFSAPIYNQSKQIIGVVVTQFPMIKVNDVFRQQTPNLGPGNGLSPTIFEIDLVSNEGLVIYSNYDKKSIMQRNVTNSQIFGLLKNSSGDNNIAYNTVERRLGRDEILVGVKQGNGHLDYKGSNWFLLIGESTQEAFGKLQDIVNQSLISSGIILSVAILIVLLFAGRISNPIVTLKRLALEVSKGNFNIKVESKQSNEIGELASSFESMRQNINEVNSNLNKLVEKRTTELSKAHENLQSKDLALEKANEELLAADRAKEEFMSMVSHELKTPLSPMKLYSQMLLKSTKSFGNLNEKQNKAITVILNSVIKLEILISDILDVYKLDIGRLRLNKIDINVDRMVDQVITEFKPLCDEQAIELDSDVRISATVRCDPQRVNQVLSNMIKNSIDFVPKKGGRIIIRAEENSSDKDLITFTVEDNGTGVPAEKVDNLFKKFYQIDTTLTRRHGGTGLGLAISKGIIEAHGGTIWIDKSYNLGSSFKFTLPRNGESV
jgi:signal transduction histidine kinase